MARGVSRKVRKVSRVPARVAVLAILMSIASTVNATKQQLVANDVQRLVRDATSHGLAQCAERSSTTSVQSMWPFSQTMLQQGTTPSECLSASQLCCRGDHPQFASFWNDDRSCIRTSTAACFRGTAARYATVTTVPMGWFLNYWNGDDWHEPDEPTVTFVGRHSSLLASNIVDTTEMMSLSATSVPAHFAERLPGGLSAIDPQAAGQNTRVPSVYCQDGASALVPCITKIQATVMMTQDEGSASASACATCSQIPVDEAADTTGACLGAYGMQDSSGTCGEGIAKQCLNNANSVSMPVCKLIGDDGMQWGFPTCLNMRNMKSRFGLGSLFYHGSIAGQTPVVDPGWIGLKLPKTVFNDRASGAFNADEVFALVSFDNVKVTYEPVSDVESDVQDNPCIKPATHTPPGTAQTHDVSTLSTAALSIWDSTYLLQIKHQEMHCGHCPARQGTDAHGYAYDWSTGLSMCRDCRPNVEVRILKQADTCDLQTYYKCEECPAHQHTASSTLLSDLKKCQDCPDSNPYRPLATDALDVEDGGDWKACGVCPAGSAFDRASKTCVELPVYVLQAGSTNLEVTLQHHVAGESNNREQAFAGNVQDYTTAGFRYVEPGEYRTGFFDIPQNCDARCEYFHYAQLCGQAFGGSDMFVKDKLAFNDPELASSVSADSLQNYEIVREGVCTLCTECTTSGQYNPSCSAETNSPGTCQDCMTALSNTCDSDEYLHHELEGGCSGERATTDYTCKKCPVAKLVDGGFYLVVGCGVGATGFRRWKPAADRSTQYPLTTTCEYSADLNAAECGNHGLLHARVIDQTNFWGDAYDLIPYCPPGWFIDATALHGTCADVTNSDIFSQFDERCCKRCQVQIGALMRADSYETCSGTTTEDTQKYVAACENGRYRVDTVDTATDAKCVDCTRCAN